MPRIKLRRENKENPTNKIDSPEKLFSRGKRKERDRERCTVIALNKRMINFRPRRPESKERETLAIKGGIAYWWKGQLHNKGNCGWWKSPRPLRLGTTNVERLTGAVKKWGVKTHVIARKNGQRHDYVWRLHTTLLMDRSSGQKISKDRVELNSAIDQWALTDFYRTLRTVVAAYTFFLDSPRPFIKRDYFWEL